MERDCCEFICGAPTTFQGYGIEYRKNSKIGTPEIITIIVLQLERLDFTVQYCVQKMQTK